jgi:hypothetical protein
MVGPATHWHGDADGDQDVDGADFLVWQRQLGGGPPATAASTAVPEPATMVLLILGSACLCGRSWVRKTSQQVRDAWR